MSAPFQPGDVVVCVDTLGPPLEDWEPRLNNLYRIADCKPSGGPVWEGGQQYSDEWMCALEEDPERDDGTGWAARMFRKIDEEVTEEFREQLRRIPAPKVPA